MHSTDPQQTHPAPKQQVHHTSGTTELSMYLLQYTQEPVAIHRDVCIRSDTHSPSHRPYDCNHTPLLNITAACSTPSDSLARMRQCLAPLLARQCKMPHVAVTRSTTNTQSQYTRKLHMCHGAQAGGHNIQQGTTIPKEKRGFKPQTQSPKARCTQHALNMQHTDARSACEVHVLCDMSPAVDVVIMTQ